MPKGIYLNSRTNGPWTTFESYLLKDENRHAGWIKWIDHQSFKIHKNPFSNCPLSPFTYLVPENVKIPEEGLIRANVEEIYKIPSFSGTETLGVYSNRFCIVDGYELFKIDELPKPFLTKDEFLYRLTNNLVGDINENFSKELAINILSCPKSIYGIGGIGAQSFSSVGGKKDLKGLNTLIKHLLPKDFLSQNKAYRYKPILNEFDCQKANFDITRKASNEISFNYLFNLSPQVKRFAMPTQIPILIPDIKYQKNEWELDRDILDYQMSALLFTPIIDETNQKKLTSVIEKTGKTILRKANLETTVDASGILRLAKAWCRLELKNNLAEDDFGKIKKDFEQIFSEFFDLSEDMQRTGRTWHIPLTPISDKMNLTIEANKIYKEIKNITRNNKYERFTKIQIRDLVTMKKISDYDLERGLKELVDAGYLLQFKNYTEFSLAL
ncbi:MAG TPA: hypothetical protein DSN98_03520 [Thermoplasmata archaeon]|jgi:hypothetical protein|nr:MAG TPA: hypothetical protein DSN98_03520 [Thermoplasmata archaeon]